MSTAAAKQRNATPVLLRALGQQEFDRLHPRIQEQYSLCSAAGACCLGHGRMESVWHGGLHTLPFLWLGSLRRIFFVEAGHAVPFRIFNYAYVDRFGRETLTWTREFEFHGSRGAVIRRFDETLIYSERRGCAVVHAGTHQHLAVDLELWADRDGGMNLRTAGQRLFLGPLTVPFPALFNGVAAVREWYDEAREEFRVEVQIRNRIWGRIFGYRGAFQLQRETCAPEAIPADVRPRREERRE